GHAHDHDLPSEITEIVSGQPHSLLFANFQDAVGTQQNADDASRPNQPGSMWSEQFLALCQRSQCAGIGAIGIGTELIVSGVYQQILTGLRQHSELSLRERVFFELHSHCDDEHAEQLLQIAEELATSDAAIAEIEFGARMAIQLRTAFWDRMLKRARSAAAEASPIENAVTNLGYETSI
ncbi:MAG: iron-containing redox enzyme family protein, partial [Gammaproteobacteria bacterium]|nr:iron-containing redox enzyme family protein [Gammaproteobacteria bacterium]